MLDVQRLQLKDEVETRLVEDAIEYRVSKSEQGGEQHLK
jgi:hypothetical protein